ncbi:hypothetical protein CPC08DRAFT_664129 [Agrocybe pediades]|nr:hypothetical protein CPC08DRAFT_664129 [Agrocybe pediades]
MFNRISTDQPWILRCSGRSKSRDVNVWRRRCIMGLRRVYYSSISLFLPFHLPRFIFLKIRSVSSSSYLPGT